MKEKEFENLVTCCCNIGDTDLMNYYYQMISVGKKSGNFKKMALKNKGEKYKDTEDLINSGSVSYKEAMLLYRFVRLFKPKIIWECGTWFGTSAAFMHLAMIHNNEMEDRGIVYTCDKHNVFTLEDTKNIIFHHMDSWDSLKELIRNKIKVDMVFADGKLAFNKVEDSARIKKVMDKCVFVTHDYYWNEKGKPEKGVKNIKQIKKYYKNCEFFKIGLLAFYIDNEVLKNVKNYNISTGD